MKVVAYWADLGPDLPRELVDLWAASWQINGFIPTLLRVDEAMKHPKYEQVLAWTETVPTVNDRQFEAACWLRWLAFELAAPAVIADYDVMNYGFRPEHIPPGAFVDLGAMTFFATPRGIAEFIAFMPLAKPIKTLDGRDHLSDLYAMRQYRASLLPCVEAGEVGELTAPLVHFSNAHVPPEWQQWNRPLAIADLTKRRG